MLNKLTIRDILEDEDIKASLVDMKDEPARFENALLYLEAVSGGEGVIVEQTENFHLGNCELRLIVREKLPKRVAFLRDGMMITQDLEGLRRFGDFKEFVGVLECHAQKGNRLLKNMEPQKHDDFEPERLPTRKEQRAGRVGLRELAVWVREMLKRHAQDPVSAVGSVDELKEFFYDDADEGSEERESEVNPLGRAIIRARPLRKKDRPVTLEEIAEAIKKGDAKFVLVLSCRDTYWRTVIETKGTKVSAEFPTGALRGEVQIFPFIIADNDIAAFECPLINSEFGAGPFAFEKGAVLAIDEPTAVYVDRDLFKPITSIFELVVNENIQGPEWQLDCSSDHVRIGMSANMKERVDAVRNETRNKAILINSVYFAAVNAVVCGDIRHVGTASRTDRNDATRNEPTRS